MSLYRRKSWMAACVLVFLAGPSARAQGLQDMQLFAPANGNPYGGGPQVKEGFFFSGEVLFLSISKPDTTSIGFPNMTRNVFYDPGVMRVQRNTHNNAWIGADFTEGWRFEVGHIQDRRGWLVSTFGLHNQNGKSTTSSMDVVFVDDEFGPTGDHLLEGYVDAALTTIENLPVTFDEVKMRNEVKTWGVELMGMHRMRPLHGGGIVELFAGIRYMEFNETFNVEGLGRIEGDPPVKMGTLADSFWNTRADNHIVGPQVGLRWYKGYGRLTCSTEGRFFAGANFQSFRQYGVFGSENGTLNRPLGGEDVPIGFPATGFSNTAYEEEWTPGVEIRLDLKYQWTKSVAFKAGWAGMWLDGIARASNSINYEVPTMGITVQDNTQNVFINGVTVGVEVNR